MAIDKKTRQKQGKFYTPAFVSQFCWRVLRAWIGHDMLHRFHVVDPAAGDGVFLREPSWQGWVDPERVFGVELFPGELDHVPLYHLIQGNGLIDQPERGFQSGTFDLVIGNPPFGGEGIRGLQDKERKQVLITILQNYAAWRESVHLSLSSEQVEEQWFNSKDGLSAAKKFATCPIEQLFLERFLMLCKNGGWCVIVLPEGLLSNYRTRWLREAVSRIASVVAVVSLPSKLFLSEGASARTAIVFLRKQTGLSTPVYLVSPTFFERPNSLAIEDYLKRVEAELTGAIPIETGVSIGRDQWTTERWDPGFWDPRLKKSLLKPEYTVEFGEFIESITYGPILPGRQPEQRDDGTPIIGQKQLTESGIDLSNALHVAVGSAFDLERSRVRQGDLLLARSGEGSLLRFKMGVYEERYPANVSCFVDRIRLQGIDPYYVWLVMKSRFLKMQILRLQNGVGAPNLNFREIRGLRIPYFDDNEQLAWRLRYRERVAPLHRQRLRSTAQAEKTAWGERAGQEFQRLVQALEEEIAQRYNLH